MPTINMHMKFEIEIPKETWLMLRKPCRLQTDGQTDKVNPVYPPSNFVGRGYNNDWSSKMFCGINMKAISQVLVNLIRNMCSEIKLLKLLPHLRGADKVKT